MTDDAPYRLSFLAERDLDATAELERVKARIERIALDIETDQRSGRLKSKFSNGVDLARRLRAALSEP